MNELNKYKLKKKLKEAGKLSWDLLITFSKVIIFMFFIITAFTFWLNIAMESFNEYQVDIMKPVLMIIWTTVIAIMLVVIDIIKNLKVK